MIRDIFTNITILVSFLFVVGQVFKHYSLEHDSPLKVRIVSGGIFGLMGIILMLFTINATDIVIVDLRNIAIICGGIFGGPVTVIVSSILIAMFRIAYFGINIASVVAFIVAILIGLGCVYISKSNYTRIKKFIYMFLIGMIVSNIALVYLLTNSPKLMEVLKYYWLINTLGGALAYYACEYIILNNKAFRELSYYQIMADNLLDVITTNKSDGKYKYASPSCEQLLGYKPSEIIDKDPSDLIHPDDISKVREIHIAILNGNMDECTQEFRIKCKDGEYLWVESSFKSFTNSKGSNKELICSTRDISERKRSEDKLRKQKEQAIEANRLKSQFLANMSHELRTPLNSIIGFTTRVLKKSKDKLSEMQQENLVIVREEAQHLLSLINDLLDYSKIEAGKMDVFIETFNLETVVNEAFSMTEGIMEEKNLKFKKVINTNIDIEIINDRIKVKQILINLLSNAFKYSKKGTIKLIIDTSDNYFRIDVVDEGIGINEEHLANIFDEFHQIDGSYTRKVGGTGLGLAITKKFIEILRGKIQVESTVNVGSCFTVYLPVDYSKTNKTNSFLINDVPLDNGCLNVNVDKVVAYIDDDFSTQRLYNQYLKDENFIPVSLDENEDIIEKIEKIKPVAIILDIILQKRDGWDILNELKQNSKTKNIPVIMSSILNEQKIAYQLHADEYLVKPVLQDELISAINRTIDHSQNIEILVADDDRNYLNLIGQYLADVDISYITAKDGKETIEMLKKHNPELVILDLMMPVLTGFEVLDWIRNSDKYKDTAVIVVSSKNLTNMERQILADSANKVIQKSGMQIEDVIKDILIEKRWKKNG